MSRLTSLGMVAMVLALAGCEKNEQTCRSAAAHFLSERPVLPVPYLNAQDQPDTVAEVTDYCEATRERALVTGCTQVHDAFMDCLSGVKPWTPEGGHTVWCLHEVLGLEACVDGVPFELACDDGKDDDDDGKVDCYDPDCTYAGPCAEHGIFEMYPQAGIREVDLLFVIDNTSSMGWWQDDLRTGISALLEQLAATVGGMPNLHLGVTSTDLGTGVFPIDHCEEGGDQGHLLGGDCISAPGASYIIDVDPKGCEILREPDNTCSAHACDQTFCAHEPTTTLAVDPDTGCPRCRNLAGQSLDEAFSCIADLGTTGCGFAQPLEAMVRALTSADASNLGFLRPDAHLAVVFLSYNDDCSAADPQLFDDTQTTLDSVLGPLTSYRCFEFGVSCDINSRTHQGLRHDCVPREDSDALLHPPSRYIQFLRGLKDPQMLVMAAITDPLYDDGVWVTLDENGQPAVWPSCNIDGVGGAPGIRLRSVVSAFTTEEEMTSWASSVICAYDYAPALAGIGGKISRSVAVQCLSRPLAGCADVGVEFGSPRAPATCPINERCLADCLVEDTFERGTAAETQREVPPCLEVMTDGTLSTGNTDRSLAYANGHPATRDANLPVSACWHIRYNDLCPQSNYAELVVSRQENPPPRSFVGVACVPILRDELVCNDGRDDDQDCLTDADDPCCQSSANCVDY